MILITHDPDIAARANRVIRIGEGRITADSGPVPAQDPGPALPTPRHRRAAFLPALHEAGRAALAAIAASPVRTALPARAQSSCRSRTGPSGSGGGARPDRDRSGGGPLSSVAGGARRNSWIRIGVRGSDL